MRYPSISVDKLTMCPTFFQMTVYANVVVTYHVELAAKYSARNLGWFSASILRHEAKVRPTDNGN